MSDKNPSLANIPAPPVELPSFITQQQSPEKGEKSKQSESKFSAAIPAEKNITAPEPKAEEKKADESIEKEKDELPSMQDIASGRKI